MGPADLPRGSRFRVAGGGRSGAPALDRENSTFRYAGSVSFRFGGPAGAGSRAGDVAGWLAQVAGRGARRIWLVLPEPSPVTGPGPAADEFELAGFANAGRQSLLVTGTGQPESWQATSAVADREAPDRRIWPVDYLGSRAGDASPRLPGPGRRAR
jgi:hypothetical protein